MERLQSLFPEGRRYDDSTSAEDDAVVNRQPVPYRPVSLDLVRCRGLSVREAVLNCCDQHLEDGVHCHRLPDFFKPNISVMSLKLAGDDRPHAGRRCVFPALVTVLWARDGAPGQRVRGRVLRRWYPSGCKVGELAHSQFKTLQPRILDLVKRLAIQDWHKRPMVCQHLHARQPADEQSAFLQCPADGQCLQFNSGIPGFGVAEES